MAHQHSVTFIMDQPLLVDYLRHLVKVVLPKWKTQLYPTLMHAIMEGQAYHFHNLICLDVDKNTQSLKILKLGQWCLKTPYLLLFGSGTKPPQLHPNLFIRKTYIAKYETPELIDAAIRAAAQCVQQDQLAKRKQRTVSRESELILKARQLRVLAAIAIGKSDREISSQLRISIPTLRSDIDRIFTVLDVSNRSAAAAFLYN